MLRSPEKVIQSIIDGITTLDNSVATVIHITGLEASAVEYIKIPSASRMGTFVARLRPT